MESNLTQRRIGLEEKIPDLKKSLAMVEYLQERRVSSVSPYLFSRDISSFFKEGKSPKKNASEDDLDDDLDLDEDESSSKPTRTLFELNDTLYAEAELEESDTVHLWLGVCLINC